MCTYYHFCPLYFIRFPHNLSPSFIFQICFSLTEFENLLEDLATSPSELFITGDFNIHVDQPSSPSALPFLDLLHDFSLTQLITFPTHSSGHTLDLLITRSTSTSISSINYFDPGISDHFALIFSITTSPQPKPSRVTKLIRSFRSIDPVAFSNDILSSALFTSLDTSLESYLHLFNNTLTSILDNHAPLKTISSPSRPHKPFVTPEILIEKSRRSKLETAYRHSRTPDSRNAFKTQARYVAKLISAAKRDYFRRLIPHCSKQPRKLWSTLNSLLSRNPPPVLPGSFSSCTLANHFISFFDQKITKLCLALKPSVNSSPHLSSPTTPPHLLPTSLQQPLKRLGVPFACPLIQLAPWTLSRLFFSNHVLIH